MLISQKKASMQNANDFRQGDREPRDRVVKINEFKNVRDIQGL